MQYNEAGANLFHKHLCARRDPAHRIEVLENLFDLEVYPFT
jgi:hypothetical protein